ncbi:3-hydroxyacyl-ACP dehydratase FabZ family protein [Symbioplanes lichenis]|uniref:3-hydroxyacyl-ACP dehydratase FabZ family protein n=1 Tax=Symbioplanes lichenis TaxID=1629072 RepID=UPI0027395FC3|nr:hypothetical protein [Actinoplanes lichenis]
MHPSDAEPATPLPGGSRSLGFSEIKGWLRHRHPMIYLDRVLDYAPGEFLTSTLSVSGTMDSLAGHFPDRAIFPASHLLQAFAQSGIILYQLTTSRLADDEITLLGSVHSRFLRIIVPGDQVIMTVRAGRIVGTTFYFSVQAVVDGRPVAKARATLNRTRVAALGPQLW